MRIGFAGAHRSGKTTLAKAVAADYEIPYWAASITDIAKNDLGIDPVMPMTLRQRIGFQSKLLDAYAERLNKAPSMFVTDRTPIDIAAYALAEVGMHTDEEASEAAALITEEAINMMPSVAHFVFLPRPLGTYEVDSTKPPPNRAYQWHVQYICEAVAIQLHDVIGVHILHDTDLVERRTAVASTLFNGMAALDELKEQVVIH